MAILIKDLISAIDNLQKVDVKDEFGLAIKKVVSPLGWSEGLEVSFIEIDADRSRREFVVFGKVETSLDHGGQHCSLNIYYKVSYSCVIYTEEKIQGNFYAGILGRKG